MARRNFGPKRGKVIKGDFSRKARRPYRRAFSSPVKSLLPRRFRRDLGPFMFVALVAGFVMAFLGDKDETTAFTDSSNQRVLTGRASVIDGDTIEIHGQRIRLNGIDAPESSQTCRLPTGKVLRCGANAAHFLRDFLNRSVPTHCQISGNDQYGRLIGTCYRADNKEAAIALVSEGHALDWPRYSNGRYASHQQSAKRAKRGIWATKFEKPWDYRHTR